MTPADTARAVQAIADALDDRDLPRARQHYDAATRDLSEEAMTTFLRELAGTVALPHAVVLYGFGIDVWANPHRVDYAWRCGDCPWTGSNYATAEGARAAAEKHAADYHRSRPPKVVNYLDDEYWDAVEAADTSSTREEKPTMGLFDSDPAYQMLKALRESGYDGPVDQNGNKVTEGGAAEILADMRKRAR